MALRRVIRACVGSARLYTAGCRGDAAALALPFGFTAPAAAQQRPVVRAAADSGMRIASWPGFMGSQRAPSHGSAALNGLHGWAGVVPRAAGPLRGILTQQSAAGTAKGKATLVLVESPAKARKIEQYLGPGYQVLASYGHVRDLPPRAGAVDPDAGFAMQWALIDRAAPQVAAIAAAARKANRLVLATDPDREGEAISWHLLQELQARGVLQGVPVERITFVEVTRAAVLAALASPRDVSGPLVDAYFGRRAIDYLFGFTLSPLLWRKLPGARSAGRVQSAALRLVCEREAAIEAFQPREYWTVEVTLHTEAGVPFQAQLTELDGQKLARGVDDGATRRVLRSQAEAQAAAERVAAAALTVKAVGRQDTTRNPAAPFTTSTLQQDASQRLGFGGVRTMSLAQELYEGRAVEGDGLITYMRTDGVQLSADAVAAVRAAVREAFGDDALPSQPRTYKTKAKNAQEAHEAIRPTDPGRTPASLQHVLDAAAWRLYDLIWRRTLASQMAAARMRQDAVDVTDGGGSLALRASTSSVESPGFLAAYSAHVIRPLAAQLGDIKDSEALAAEHGTDADTTGVPRWAGGNGADPTAAAIRSLQRGDTVTAAGVAPLQHWTKPPGRLTEGTLVKAMEEAGIGRPSTYAPIIRVLQDRKYVSKEGRTLHAESLGRVLTAFLQAYFPDVVDYGFTSALEAQLDDVSGGRADWTSVCSEFWTPLSSAAQSTAALSVRDVIDVLDGMLEPQLFPPQADGADPRKCLACGGRLGLKPAHTGGFIGCSNYPTCRHARPLGVTGDASDALTPDSDGNGIQLGQDPRTSKGVFLRVGPYGPYVQLGESPTDKADPKPARAPIKLKGDELPTLEEALRLLEPPAPLGLHPADQQPVTVGVGKFGPYVRHGKLNASIPKGHDPQSISLERALEVLAAKKTKVEAKAAKAAASGVATSGKDAANTAPAASEAVSAADNGRKPPRTGAASKGSGRKAGSAARQRIKAEAKSGGRRGGSSKARLEGLCVSEDQQNGSAEQAAQNEASGAVRKSSPNAYMHWKQQRWPVLKAEHPDKGFKELMKLTSVERTNLEPAIKLRLKQEAAAQQTPPFSH